MISIESTNGHSSQIPSSWDEMTDKQIREVFQLHDECVRKGRSPLEFNVRVLLFVFLGLRPSWKLSSLSKDIQENVYFICEKYLGFLFSESNPDSGIPELAFSGVENPLPVLRRPFRRPLKGPGALLQGLTFGQFRQASRALQEFFKSRDVACLDECIAWLYDTDRHPVKDGRDPRAVAKIPRWEKNLIMSWFSACLNQIQTGILSIDGEDIDMRLLFSGGGSDNPAERFTWRDLTVQLAKDGVIGNMEAVDEEPLFSILALLWSNYKENKRHEKIRKTSKAK